ncbi:hypothetical protein OAC51_07835 [Flavobacteriaceae bacterium]|nr:hypothetical protein [Flavobacteriaceae bacterium]
MNLELIQKIQNLELDNEFLLTKGISHVDISKPIELNDILFRKTKRSYGYGGSEDLPFEMEYTLEAFDCYTYKENLTLLGVLFFELLFSEQPFIEFKILNQQSDYKQLFVYLDRENRHAFQSFLEIENKETYKSFEYYPSEIEKFPLSQFPQNVRTVFKDELPTFLLGSSDKQFAHSKEFTIKSDQLIISTTTTGLIQLAELLLDIGLLKNTLNEVCLENPIYGFGGVSEKSIEARFWLPDSLGFYTERIEDLKF